MNDYEVDVFDMLYRLIVEEYPGAYVSSRHVSAPAAFPAVSIIETSSTELSSTADSSLEEKYTAVTYTVNVYSNEGDGGKEQCKSIASIVSSALRALNFVRTMCEPVDNAADPTIYRMTMRFTAAIAQDGTTFRR